jgi:photosystem II stability/assembly factor-like uncharacterized protein
VGAGSGTQGIYSMTFPAASTAYAAGANRTLLRSADGGATWTSICTTACAALAATHDFLGITSAGVGTVWAATYNGEIIASTNADQASPTWTLQQAATGTPINSITALSATDVYYADNGGWIYKTVNGGTAWNQVTGAGGAVHCLVMERSAGTDYLYGARNSGKIYKGTLLSTDITNGGGTYSTMTLPGNGGGESPLGCWGVSKDIVLLSMADGSVWKSVNASNASPTFTREDTGVGTEVGGIYVDPGGTAYGATQGGVAIVSSDTGSTWTVKTIAAQTQRPDWRYGHGFDASNAYVVGSKIAGVAQMLHTTNGGTTWTSVASGLANNGNGLAFEDIDHGIAVGDAGTVSTSSNASSATPTWTARANPTAQNLDAVGMAAGTSTGWAVGDLGTILRTDDGGVTWVTQSSGFPTTNLRSVAVVDPGTVFVSGDSGLVLRTTDGGTTWTQLTTSVTNDLESIGVADAGAVIYSGGSSGKIIKSTNGLAAAGSVTFASMTTNSSYAVLGLDVENRANVEAAARNGTLLRTTDGTTWSGADAPSTSQDMVSVSQVDGNTTWEFGVGDRIYLESPAASIPDYQNGVNSWSTAANTGFFGACLQSLGGSAAADAWTVDTFNVSGQCQTLDTDPWNAIPTTATKIAHTTGAGQSGSVNLIYGIRTPSSTTPGSYTAAIAYEAVAPWV